MNTKICLCLIACSIALATILPAEAGIIKEASKRTSIEIHDATWSVGSTVSKTITRLSAPLIFTEYLFKELTWDIGSRLRRHK